MHLISLVHHLLITFYFAWNLGTSHNLLLTQHVTVSRLRKMNQSRINNEDILYTASDEVYNPINLDTFLVISKRLSCSIGMPLNLSVAFTIARPRSLRRKPRNIFLLAIVFSFLSFFAPVVIGLIYWGLYPMVQHKTKQKPIF